MFCQENKATINITRIRNEGLDECVGGAGEEEAVCKAAGGG